MSRTARVLVVDDEEDMLQLVEEAVHRMLPGTTTRTASSMMDALQILAAESVDLIISDYRLQGPNGLELLRKIRDVPEGPRFILMTAFSDSSLEEAALRAGADAFLRKPLDPQRLLDTSGRLLREAAPSTDRAEVSRRQGS